MAFRHHNTSAGTQCLIVVSFTLSILACQFQTIRHSSLKAALDTNQFLKALYFDEDFAEALRLAGEQLRQSVTADTLKKMVDEIGRERGRLKNLRADSYLMTQGQSMELFYIGEYETGVLYHRLVLIGDASSGYKVTGVWFQPDPYPTNSLRRKFDADIFVMAPTPPASQ